ncbi:MAG: cellobiose phosphorylase [Candidatus Omnitrophica bacterium]|nr:cellobiose phosphorylase [Candidatus Omnitrophota bacterium]
MEKFWRFKDNSGSFEFPAADKIKTLYFPLCNQHLMSSITPDLHGDIKAGQNSFLMPPVSRIDLSTSKASRNFWIYIDKNKIWSATGVSKDLKQIKEDHFNLSAGLLWHRIERENVKVGLKSEILSFVPASGEPIEIMQVKLTNISGKKIQFIPTAAIPIYARGVNNIRDHRQVTSLLQRLSLHKFGVISKPTLSFDESGHKPNKTYFFILGWDEKGKAPDEIYPTQEMFCGESGDLEAPESILENRLSTKENIQGREAMGALRFKSIGLTPGKSYSYIIVMGITENNADIAKIINKFKSLSKVKVSLEHTKKFWIEKSQGLNLFTGNEEFDNWFRWVSIQPVLRKIFGCSFLPDFDYGKGGRGWRDLWQDCLGLILSEPKKIRPTLLNNFSGVRIDGSNATIIGKSPGEFIADRNDIPRVWMDHGVWPLLTTELYINKSGDRNILFEKTSYFQDKHVWRSRRINYNWKPCDYKGSIFEHLLLENLTQFFNVGPHNHIRLEGADWNDGLDMANENGESVAFSCMYASNLRKLAQLLQDSSRKEIKIFAEFKILLRPCNYNNIKAKQKILEEYFARVENGARGEIISVDCSRLIKDLEAKADWMSEHIRKTEWVSEGFFNGYYDNKKKRVEGKIKGKVRMMLASQVFAVMSGVAEDWQVKKIIASVEKYLFDKKLRGYHLNTDFEQERHDLGRAFSFVYGDKENGAIFSHMVVMYAYALYSRGFSQAGHRALDLLYNLAINSAQSKIYPCLPEYFNSQGRGMYSYLTGSASWFILTVHSFPY